MIKHFGAEIRLNEVHRAELMEQARQMRLARLAQGEPRAGVHREVLARVGTAIGAGLVTLGTKLQQSATHEPEYEALTTAELAALTKAS